MPVSRTILRIRIVANLLATGSIILFSGAAHAAVKRISSTAGATMVWTTASKWNPGAVPTATDDLIFDYTNEASTKTALIGLNAAGDVANSLTFGGSTANGALGAFELRANTASPATARTLTLGTSAQNGAGSITVDSSVIGTQSLGTNGTLFGLMTITLASGVAGFTVTNNSSTQTLDLGAKLAEGATPGSIATFSSAGGKIILEAANTYTGATSVAGGGTLLTNNTSGSGTGSGAVTVNGSGTTLGGTGTITGNVTVNGTARLQGGDGTTGTSLKLSGNLTLASNSIIQLALGPSLAHSTLARTGTGTWTFDSNQAFTFINLGATTGTYQNIITGLAADPGTEGTWTITNSAFLATFSYDGANIDLTLSSSVPEPGTWAGAALALAMMLYLERRTLLLTGKREH